MALFRDADDVYSTIGVFCTRMLTDPELGPLLNGLDMSMQLAFTDPDCAIVLDCRGTEPKVDLGPVDYAIDTRLEMTADTGHKLWLGDLNPTLAMASRKIKPSGKLAKAMGLQKILDPAQSLYRAVLREQGRDDLLDA